MNPNNNSPQDPTFLLVLDELLKREPAVPVVPPPPYRPTDKYINKVQTTYAKMIRALSVYQRQHALLYAYYLGQLINGENTTSSQRKKAESLVSKHYAKIAERTFRIFEVDPGQIFRTVALTTMDLYNLSLQDYLSFVPEEVFPGGSN